MVFKIILCIVIGYLLGSVVAAILVSNLFFKEDVRSHGSGNSGATNTARVYGLWYGILTFAVDFVKGIIACWLGRLLAGDVGCAVAGFACIVGHCFPVFFRFRGGKGVSVGAAFALMIHPAPPWIFILGLTVFIILVIVTKIVSAGSVGAIITVGICSLIFPPNPAVKVIGLIAALLVIVMHHSNIMRLLNGKEKQITFGKR